MAWARADRWQFFVQEMGVKDKELAHAISKRLADDADAGVLTLISGVLLLAAGMTLGKRAGPASSKAAEEKSGS